MDHSVEILKLQKEIQDLNEEKRRGLKFRDDMMAVLSTAGHGIWLWNKEGNLLQFDNIQSFWEDDLGYLPGEYSNNMDWWFQNLHPASQHAYTEAIDMYFSGKKTFFELEYRLKTKSGDWAWFWKRGISTGFDENGNPVSMLGVYSNTTEKNKLQQLLIDLNAELEQRIRERTQQLSNLNQSLEEEIDRRKLIEQKLQLAVHRAEIANKAKSDFLANMSHDIRTPLNAIFGFTQLLAKQLSPILNDKQLKYFNNIKISGTHLMEMVNEILDLAKIEAGKMELDLKPFDLGGMLDGLTDIIKEEAYKKKLQLIKNIQPDSGWILGDEKRLKQVILNLLSNAMKFTEPGNRIGIDTRIDGDDIIVTVWDEGAGITEKDLGTIFDPFVQGTGGKTSLEKGTGLGLSISKRLIELHRGTITVLSKEGEGSQFIISLPSMFLVDEQPSIDPSDPQKEAILQPGKSARILVTEDNRFNRELIAAALHNLHLDFAVSGEDAVILVSDKDYDLVIMDIQLPGIDGIETLKQIRQIQDKKIPVIALTAFAMKGDREKYLDIGFDDYLSKPIDISILIQKIEHILS